MKNLDIKQQINQLNLTFAPIFDKQEQEKYINDWRDQYFGNTQAVLKPANTNEVSKILKLAHKQNITIVPQGGNTSLCGGATPNEDGNSIIITLEKMNNIRSINLKAKTITLDAGVILSAIHEEVEKNKLFFPLNLGAKGSCMIGGNLSTNAGGINVLKYGNSRDLCLGLEVVLPDGRIMNLLSELKKDNTGYDLKNLFIGAEGTLGIITGATLKLFPLPKLKTTVFVEANKISNALKLLNIFQAELPGSIEAFELMPKIFWTVAQNNIENLVMPLNNIPEMGVLIEISSYSEIDIIENNVGEIPIINKIEIILTNALEAEIISDGTICKNEAQSRALWLIRESSAETEKKELTKSGAIKCLKHDISLPLEAIEDFHRDAQKMINVFAPNLKTIFFGHLGDGNLHYNVFGNGKLPDGFNGDSKKLTENLYEIVHFYNGSFSAEHGIGQLRKESLKKHKDPIAFSIMNELKKQFDPKGIMNPGKIL